MCQDTESTLKLGAMQGRPKGTTFTFILTLVFTLAYGLVLAFLPLYTAPCSDPPDAGWFSRNLSCRSASDLGDFLSGAFAPLAFIWLVAAVIIQSLELRAQREELLLARREYWETRQVLQAQATEAKTQASFIGQQTQLLKDEGVARLADAGDRRLDAMSANFEYWARNMLSADIRIIAAEQRGPYRPGERTRDLERDNLAAPVDGNYSLRTICGRILGLHNTVLNLIAEGTFRGFHGPEAAAFSSACKRLAKLTLVTPLTDVWRDRLDDIGVALASQRAKELSALKQLLNQVPETSFAQITYDDAKGTFKAPPLDISNALHSATEDASSTPQI